MKNRIIIALFLCLSFCYDGVAQQDNVRTQANAIKKNSDYIYGESAGDNEEECYEMAKEKLLSKVQSFIANQSELSTADAVIVDNIQSKTKKLTYERSIQIKVVCVYVHKSDILPMYKSKTNVLVKANVKPAEKTIEKEEEANVVYQQEEVKNVVLESKEEVIELELVEEKIKDNKNNTVQEKTNPQIKTEFSVDNSNIEKPLTYSKRENEIISAILKMKQYNEIFDFLEKEKNTRYDIRFKLVKEIDVEDCFWLVFNPDRKLIAVFDKEHSVIQGSKDKRWDSYKNYPKMWIYVYE